MLRADKLPSSCTIITQTPAQKRLPKEKYELQNEEELPVAMVRKKTWVALPNCRQGSQATRTKDSRVAVGPHSLSVT